MIHLVPAKDKRVREPNSGKLIGPEGIRIEAINTYWFRRLQDGDVVEKSAAKKEKVKEGDK